MVVVLALVVAAVLPLWLAPLLLLGMNLIIQGVQRYRIESSTPVRPPLVLPAVSDPGAYARLPEPRPSFGIRLLLRPVRGAVWFGTFLAVPVVIAAALAGPIAAIGAGLLWLGLQLWLTIDALNTVPVEVRVTATSLEWRARRRREVIALASLRRLRCSTSPGFAVVLEFEGHEERLLLVTGGFADFLEALTVACPWIDVSPEIVKRFGSWTGKYNAFYVDAPDPDVEPDLQAG